jgi:hypothetical protein
LEKRPIGVGLFLRKKIAIREIIIEGPGPFIAGGGLQDALAVELKLSELAVKTKPSAKEILSVNQVFGNLSENAQFAESVERVVKLLYEIGSTETLKQWNNEAPNKK